MLVGGCVRDRLLGVEPSDYDLATTALPDQVTNCFERAGFRIVPLGVEHGSVKVVTPLQRLEITTLRKDIECDGRHARVSFSSSFEEDARRRDFTINALFEDGNGRIHDFIGGLKDIEAKKLRFVGEPSRRIEEDYLRILRYFRFLGRLGWVPCPEDLTTIGNHVDGLDRLSGERVLAELDRIFGSEWVGEVVRLMAEAGVIGRLFPWLRETRSLVRLLDSIKKLNNVFSWFSILYWGGNRVLDRGTLSQVFERFRLTREHKKTYQALARLFGSFDNLFASLRCLIDLKEKIFSDPRELQQYVNACRKAMGVTVPGLVYSILDEIADRHVPVIPREELLKIPELERGETVSLVKIYWYLGLCRDKNQAIHILKNRGTYKKQLEMGKPTGPS